MDRVRAAAEDCDEPYPFDRGRDWRSDASSVLATLTPFCSRNVPASPEFDMCCNTVNGRAKSR